MTISYQQSTSSSSSSSTSLVVSSSNPSLVVSTTIPSSLNPEEYHKRLFHKKMACAAANIADFIKRLYRMLEDKSYSHIVSWGVTGDTFVVHDPTEFAKSILPQHFKHNNMASFVRQLNKYDFHKIKSNDDDTRPYNEQAWEFQHPKFQLNRKDLLEDIKRKIPTPRNKNISKQNVSSMSSIKNESRQQLQLQQHQQQQQQQQHNHHHHHHEESDDDTSSSINSKQNTNNNNININNNIHNGNNNTNNVLSTSAHSNISVNTQYDLRSQVESLTELHADLAGHVDTLSRNCGTILEEIITFKRNLAAQDTLLSNLYQILAQQFNNNNVNVNVNSSGMNSANNNTTDNNNTNTNDNTNTTNTSTITDNTSSSDRRYSSISLNPSINSTNNDNSTHDYHNSDNNNTSTNLSPGETSSILPLMNDMFSSYAVAVNATQQSTLNLNQFNTPNPSPPITTAANDRLFFRSNSVPNWSIQPKILFVDDELFVREDGNQWYQAYGCQFDVAADGITAVNKMQIHQYDIVFMDIELQSEFNGLSVTQQIRRFNNEVPIIGMPPPQSSSNSNNNQSTNNSTNSDYVNYLRSGMNDLLPKPFTRQELFNKIDKFCNHLKTNNVLISPSSQNDGDNSTTIQQRQAGISRQSRTLSSISSNLNATNTHDATQQQQQHQINYLSASHIDLYRQQQTAGQIHRLNDDNLDNLDDLSSINNENSRKRRK
ncbi:stress response regulator/HFS transcription factor [Rhizophagus clarus]|uniref:Transcription factor n=1 Tax=Rhizophagus clarus TaxID=94130 RepID=A0A8H3R157_9GLOM|nr:stress response regulator/HFS transcription factor [Rhizophagus clarus]